MKKYLFIFLLTFMSYPAFAQRVSDLPPATLPLDGSELLSLDQNGVTKRVPSSVLLNGSFIVGFANGGTGLSNLGSPLTCLQVNSSGTTLQYGPCGGGGSGGTPGGLNGQTQYNNFGAFGGYTMSGDCTLNTTTGVITCGTLSGVSPFNLGSSTTASPRISGDVTSGFYTAGPGKVDVEALGSKAMEWTSTSVTVPSLPAYSLTGTTTGGTLTNVFIGPGLSLTTTGGVTTLTSSSSPAGFNIIEENGPNIVEENGPNIVEENAP